MLISFGRDARRRFVVQRLISPGQAPLTSGHGFTARRPMLLRRTEAGPTGFTLVELMITVAIIGLLAGVAIPQFLNARNRADARAKIGEVLGIAKECAAFNAEADPTTTSVHPPVGNTIDCGGTTPEARNLASRNFVTSVTIDCLGQTFEDASSVIIKVNKEGQMSCTESNSAPS